MDPKYGFHAARSLSVLLEQHAPSTTIKIVNKSAFSKILIPVPSLAEQERIASILDVVDVLRIKRRESIAQLDTLVQAAFLEVFGDPVGNPKRWADTGTLADVATVSSGITKGRKTKEDTLTTVPYLAVVNV